jgi:hypothetical protein
LKLLPQRGRCLPKPRPLQNRAAGVKIGLLTVVRQQGEDIT